MTPTGSSSRLGKRWPSNSELRFAVFKRRRYVCEPPLQPDDYDDDNDDGNEDNDDHDDDDDDDDDYDDDENYDTYVRNGNDDDDDDDEDGNHDAIVIMGVRTYVRSVAINACHESILQGVASQLNQPLGADLGGWLVALVGHGTRLS